MQIYVNGGLLTSGLPTGSKHVQMYVNGGLLTSGLPTDSKHVQMYVNGGLLTSGLPTGSQHVQMYVNGGLLTSGTTHWQPSSADVCKLRAAHLWHYPLTAISTLLLMYVCMYGNNLHTNLGV